MTVPVFEAGAAALALSAVSSVVSARLYARRQRRVSIELFMRHSLITKHIEAMVETLTKKAARLSPKQQVQEALRRVQNLRMLVRP